MSKWLLLVYKIPREPSAARVGIWRKIKQLAAVRLQDAVWVLPANARTQEQFQWLTAEIIELGGEATLCVSEMVSKSQHHALVKQFSANADNAYKRILADLRRKDPDLPALGRKYQQVLAADFFESQFGESVRSALLAKGDTSS